MLHHVYVPSKSKPGQASPRKAHLVEIMGSNPKLAYSYIIYQRKASLRSTRGYYEMLN